MRIVDLTFEIVDGGASQSPAYPPARISDFDLPPPYNVFEAKQLAMVDHFGTHMDAPRHVYPGMPTVESVPLDRLCGPGVLVDATFRPEGTPVGPEVLEQSGAPVRRGDIVLVRCFAGPCTDPAWAMTRALTGDAAVWLRDRGARAVGVDLYSVDDRMDSTRPVHHLLLKERVILMEGVMNLGEIASPRFLFVGVPLRLKGATGSPIRAMALTELGDVVASIEH